MRIAEVSDADITQELASLAKKIESALRIEFSVWPTHFGAISLSSIIVPKEKQGQGLGTKALEALCRFADKHGRMIVLSPGEKDKNHGTTSRNRLIQFYKRFGFVENKGRRKDFRFMAGMYRLPLSTHREA